MNKVCIVTLLLSVTVGAIQAADPGIHGLASSPSVYQPPMTTNVGQPTIPGIPGYACPTASSSGLGSSFTQSIPMCQSWCPAQQTMASLQAQVLGGSLPPMASIQPQAPGIPSPIPQGPGAGTGGTAATVLMQFKAALSENAALRCQLEQSYALCEQLREQLLAQLQAAEERLNTVTRDFQFQIETLTSSARNDSITREIQANEITALSRQLKREQEKNAAKKELETRCRDLQDRIDYLEDMENRNTLELAGLRARVAEADASASTIANLRSTVDALQKQTTSLSRQLEESRRQYAETMSQLVGISQAAGGK